MYTTKGKPNGQGRKNMRKNTEKKELQRKEHKFYMVRAYRGLKGWVDFKFFEDFNEADDWLCDYVRSRHLDIRDFNIREDIAVEYI